MPGGALPTNRVALASGIVAEQTGCSIAAALILLNETAHARACTLEELAGKVIDHQVDFK
jgi:AmiR/NasT family two-component response regulator